MPPVLVSLASRTSAVGIDHRPGDGLGMPLQSGPRAAALPARPAIWPSLRSWSRPSAARDDVADVAHPRPLLEDDVAAGQRHQGGQAHGAVLDVGHRLHVLDPRRSGRPALSTTVSLAPGLLIWRISRLAFSSPGLLDALGQVRDHHRCPADLPGGSRPGGSTGRASGRRRPTGRRSGRCSPPRPGCRRSACRSPRRGPACAVEHAAQAAVPGGPLLDHLVRLLERGEVLGQDVMHGLVGRADQPEVGVAIEHPQQQVGVAGLADGQEPDLLPIRRRSNGWSFGRDRAQGRRRTHHDLGAGDDGQDGVAPERLRDVGDRQLGAGQFPGDQVGQVVADAELAGARRRSRPARTRRPGSAASPAWPTRRNRRVAASPRGSGRWSRT